MASMAKSSIKVQSRQVLEMCIFNHQKVFQQELVEMPLIYSPTTSPTFDMKIWQMARQGRYWKHNQTLCRRRTLLMKFQSMKLMLKSRICIKLRILLKMLEQQKELLIYKNSNPTPPTTRSLASAPSEKK